MITNEEQQQFEDIKKKLDVIDKKVTSEEPSWWSVWWPRIKYVLIGVAWIVGQLTHKWGFFHKVSSWLG